MGNQSKEVQKAPQKKEANDVKKEKTPEKVRSENEKAQKKLAETIQKPAEKKAPRKEKQWHIGLGTTEVESPDHQMKIATSGLKLENKKKTTELTVGITSIEEQERPGAFPKNTVGLFGVSFARKF